MIDYHQRVRRFERESHKLFEGFERSTASRVFHLRDLAKTLQSLPVDVQSYFQEALDCLESKLYRSAVVMAWAGFFSVFVEDLFANKQPEIAQHHKKLSFADGAELKEKLSEFAILETAKIVKFIKNPAFRKYDGQLSTRNSCAHPSLYKPSSNEAIAFVELMIVQTRTHI